MRPLSRLGLLAASLRAMAPPWEWPRRMGLWRPRVVMASLMTLASPAKLTSSCKGRSE